MSQGSILSLRKRIDAIPSLGISSVGSFYRSFQWIHDVGKKFIIQDEKRPSHVPELPNIEILSPLVTRILGGNPSSHTLQGTNTYLVGNGRKRILIDTGEGKEVYIKYLRQAMQEIGCEEIEKIIISHRHGDHIGGISSIQKEFSKTVTVNDDETTESSSKASVLNIFQKNGKQNHSTNNNKIPVYKFIFNDQLSIDDSTKSNNKDLAHEYIPLEDGQRIITEGATLRVCYTPGHTEDHCCFWLEEECSLISGDCILGHGTAYFEDYINYMKSLNKLFHMAESFGKNNFKCIYPGHGVCLDQNPLDTISMYIDHRELREKQILVVLKKSGQPLTSLQITNEVYGKDISFVILVSAQNNVEAQLKKLLLDNKVIQLGYLGGFYTLSKEYIV